MSDETVAGSRGSIPVEDKIKMYSYRAEIEAMRIKEKMGSEIILNLKKNSIRNMREQKS